MDLRDAGGDHNGVHAGLRSKLNLTWFRLAESQSARLQAESTYLCDGFPLFRAEPRSANLHLAHTYLRNQASDTHFFSGGEHDAGGLLPVPQGGVYNADFTLAPPEMGLKRLGLPLLSLIHISEPTRLRRISYAVFCLKKKKKK